ncbi:M48 family metallopeptidase [Oxynema aestuarii]|jgi:Zn-dependent protease with chaperone function|uniref:M48 family metallopeptidase n=1 Tax=Oxynema aestuarii AP17 TaxID=2064643 RepID=A0A6H1TRH2_9CYAN|nr:M48 family metallopeptidase [Oxynema aestuarii]QIZ69192.1 M48 family metallopeptidase [Oxynema aestuarii AP17]RMH77349.1 MAG: M48 family peptidase [Cyanobacteria bacterium J007]
MPTYTGISSEAFRHPLDREAEQSLRSIPGFDLVARKFIEFLVERPQYVFLMGNSIQVGPRQYSSIYRIFRECVRDLDIYPEPNLFISQTPLANAYALGQDYPYMVLNTGLLDLLEEDQLRATIAHELGHIKCGHTTLMQMATWAISATFFLADLTMGMSRIVSTSLVLAFYEWLRKAELSADRAALLVVDDLNPVMHTMMRMAGGSTRYAHECSLDELVRQSERYQHLDEDGLNQVYKFFLYNNISQGVFMTHPFTVERITYLRDWANSNEYAQIRAGNYRREGSRGSVDVEATPSEGRSPRGERVEQLRQEIERLQNEIDRIKSDR